MIQWMSVSDYAKKTNLTEPEVRRLIKEKKLEAELSEGGGKYYIKTEANDDVIALTAIVKDLLVKVDRLSNHLGIKGIEYETGREYGLAPRKS